MYKNKNQNKTSNGIFNLFEKPYFSKIQLKQQGATQKNLLEILGFTSIKELHNDFDSKLKELVNQKKSDGELHLGNEKRSWKQFFNDLKNMAKNEKEAYTTNKRLREYFDDLETPTNAELDSLKYKEMEKFFAQKRIEVNKEIPKF